MTAASVGEGPTDRKAKKLLLGVHKMWGPRWPVDTSRGGCCHGGKTTTKRRGSPVVSHEKNANKDPRGFSAPRGAAAAEVQLRPGRAKLDGGGQLSDAPQPSGPCCTCNCGCPVILALSMVFLFSARKTFPGLPVCSVIFPNHASELVPASPV